MRLFDRHRSRWWFFIGAAIGLAFNLGLLPYVQSRSGHIEVSLSPVASASAMVPAPAAAPAPMMMTEDGYEAMRTVYTTLWGTTFDENDDILVRTDATGVYFYAASKALTQSNNALDTRRPCKLAIEYQDERPLPNLPDSTHAADFVLSETGITMTRYSFAGGLGAAGGNLYVAGDIFTLSTENFAPSPTDGFTMLAVTGIYDTKEQAVSAAKTVHPVREMNGDDAFTFRPPHIGTGPNHDGVQSTDCLSLPCEDRCACEYNHCTSQRYADYWDNVHGAAAAAAVCSLVAVTCNAMFIFCVAACWLLFAAAEHYFWNQCQRAWQDCATTYEACMFDNCHVLIYAQ